MDTFRKISLADNPPISPEEYAQACRIASEIARLADAEEVSKNASGSWTTPAGMPIYGAVIKDDPLKPDFEIINHFRQHVWQFSGYHLSNVISDAPKPSWTDQIVGNIPTSVLQSVPDWSIPAFVEITRELPTDYVCRPPLKLGEVGWMVNGGVVNRDIIAYQERVALLYHSGIIDELRRRKDVRIIEIGGGYGGLAYFLKRIIPDAHYFIVDLPLSLFYSAVYLTLTNPACRHMIYSKEMESALAEARDFTFVPNFLFDDLQSLRFDLAINTLSFAEMPGETVESYVRGLARMLGASGYLFEQNFDNSHLKHEMHCDPQERIPRHFSQKREISEETRWGRAHLWSNCDQFPSRPAQVPNASSIAPVAECTSEEMPVTPPLFSFLIPTRGRPDLVARLFQSIVDTTSDLANLEVILVVDDDDELSKGISDDRITFKLVVVPRGLTMGGLNLACYRESTGRYIMLMNDDVILRTPAWDKTVLSTFERFTDDIALVHVNDLLFRERLCTFPFVSRTACEMIGLCPEVYRRYKIDDHIYEIYSMLAHLGHKRIIYLPDVVFEHENHATEAGPSASEQHVFVSQDSKMYVPHGPTIEKDDKDFTERHGERKTAALQLAAHIEGHRIKGLHEERLGMYGDKLNAIKDPYLFRKPSFVTVQNERSPFSTATHRTTIAVVCSDLRKEMTRKCLAAIKEHTSNYDMVVLDNANSSEFNHPAEMNRAIRSTTTDFLVLMDDDVFVEQGWLDGLLKCIDDRTAVVAPVHKGKAPFSGAYLMGDGRGTHAHTTDLPASPRVMQCYCSAILLIDMRKVGHLLMKEQYNKYFFDLVHGLQVWEAGYQPVCTPEVVVTHVGGGTMQWASPEAAALVEKDRQMFVEDWVDSGRLARLENGVWQQHPYLKKLVDLPARIRGLRSAVSSLPEQDLIKHVESLRQEVAPFDLFRGFLQETLAGLSTTLVASLGNQFSNHIEAADFFFGIRQHEVALNLLKSAIEAAPFDAAPWVIVARIARELKDHQLFATACGAARDRNATPSQMAELTEGSFL